MGRPGAMIMRALSVGFLLIFLINIGARLDDSPGLCNIITWVVALVGFAVAWGEATKVDRAGKARGE